MTHEVSYKTYWTTWLGLAFLTIAMILASRAGLPHNALTSLLLMAMVAKAGLICGTFMHLRFEKLALSATVLLGLVLTAAALFFGIAPDGMRLFYSSLR